MKGSALKMPIAVKSQVFFIFLFQPLVRKALLLISDECRQQALHQTPISPRLDRFASELS